MTCIYILHQLSWGYNQTPKSHLWHPQVFTGSYKKTWRLWINSKYTEYQKSKKVNKLWQKCEQCEQHNVKFTNLVYLTEKEAYNNKWILLVHNALRRAGSDYFANDNFWGTFADFRLKIFNQGKLSSCGDLCP